MKLLRNGLLGGLAMFLWLTAVGGDAVVDHVVIILGYILLIGWLLGALHWDES